MNLSDHRESASHFLRALGLVGLPYAIAAGGAVWVVVWGVERLGVDPATNVSLRTLLPLGAFVLAVGYLAFHQMRMGLLRELHDARRAYESAEARGRTTAFRERDDLRSRVEQLKRQLSRVTTENDELRGQRPNLEVELVRDPGFTQTQVAHVLKVTNTGAEAEVRAQFTLEECEGFDGFGTARTKLPPEGTRFSFLWEGGSLRIRLARGEPGRIPFANIEMNPHEPGMDAAFFYSTGENQRTSTVAWDERDVNAIPRLSFRLHLTASPPEISPREYLCMIEGMSVSLQPM